MRMFKWMLLLGVVACGDDLLCVTPSCVAPAAVEVSPTSAATAAPLDSVHLHVTGPAPTDLTCARDCFVYGYAGTYEIDISAARFQPAHRSVVVTAAPTPKCGCPTVDRRHIAVALTPVAPSPVVQ